MSRESDRVEGKTSFVSPSADRTSTGEGAVIVLGVEGNQEWLLRVLVEALGTIPCGVLECQESSIGVQDEVKVA